MTKAKEELFNSYKLEILEANAYYEKGKIDLARSALYTALGISSSMTESERKDFWSKNPDIADIERELIHRIGVSGETVSEFSSSGKGSICSKCGREIKPGETFTTIEGKKYHWGCYK